ncbi:MAG: TIGR04063 family PEP-CTERM/XrtA system glycosyltransferase [Betaproteobacteria bacterium]
MTFRILHILDHSLPLHSGYAFRTAAILREQRALGWETMQLTTPRHGGDPAESEEADGWRFHRTPLERNRWSNVPGVIYLQEMHASARRIAELAASFHPHVLHAHSPVLNALPAIRVGRRMGIPVVYEVRALWEDAAVDHGTTREGSPRYRLSHALETYALRRADHITTICEGLRSEIIARGISPGRITVIPNAVDVDEFRLDGTPDAALRTRLGLDGSTVIGFAGSFYAYEGLDLLIEAATRLLPRLPRLRLLLVGGGPQEQALKALVAAHGIADRVVFTGRVPHDEVQRYYDLIDVLAYPRHRMRLTELVTPLKPLEAMAQGRMFVASDVGGHRELVRDGQTGFLFAAGDADALAQAIESVLARAADWPRIREQARRFVETERTWARSVGSYARVYQSLQVPTAAGASRLILPRA